MHGSVAVRGRLAKNRRNGRLAASILGVIVAVSLRWLPPGRAGVERADGGVARGRDVPIDISQRIDHGTAP